MPQLPNVLYMLDLHVGTKGNKNILFSTFESENSIFKTGPGKWIKTLKRWYYFWDSDQGFLKYQNYTSISIPTFQQL